MLDYFLGVASGAMFMILASAGVAYWIGKHVDVIGPIIVRRIVAKKHADNTRARLINNGNLVP